MTRTYAILEVSAAAYAEIKAKLLAAGYEHAIHADDEREVVDMHGIAVAAAPRDHAGSDPVIACARAAHEANRAYCIAIGDNSQPAWDDAPDWQRSSAIIGVSSALAGATPEQSHEAWLREKMVNGWKYGPVKNPDTKEHPCFVPYADLPPAQRAKDALFLAVVRATAAALGVPSTKPA